MPTRTPRFAVLALLPGTALAFAHGDVPPQPVNTDALPDMGEEWLIETPYRGEVAGDVDAVKSRLVDLAGQIETPLGASIADSIALRAAKVIDGSPASFKTAAETLTIGLSAAH